MSEPTSEAERTRWRLSDADRAAIAHIYRLNHPGIPGWISTLDHETKWVVRRDEISGEVRAFAAATCVDFGVVPFGMIHFCEVAPDYDDPESTRRSLIANCIDWLKQRGASYIDTTALDQVTPFTRDGNGPRLRILRTTVEGITAHYDLVHSRSDPPTSADE